MLVVGFDPKLVLIPDDTLAMGSGGCEENTPYSTNASWTYLPGLRNFGRAVFPVKALLARIDGQLGLLRAISRNPNGYQTDIHSLLSVIVRLPGKRVRQ